MKNDLQLVCPQFFPLVLCVNEVLTLYSGQNTSGQNAILLPLLCRKYQGIFPLPVWSLRLWILEWEASGDWGGIIPSSPALLLTTNTMMQRVKQRTHLDVNVSSFLERKSTDLQQTIARLSR